MTGRLRRLQKDHEEVQQEFCGHKYIKVIPDSTAPPEKYNIVYKVTGIMIGNMSGNIEEIHEHKVEIYLPNDYPKSIPKCTIRTPIYHPNFQSQGKICIGDHWAAGETLVDLIIRIGDMIQYRDYNYRSPLNADAARWTQENENRGGILPVSNIDLRQAEPEIDIETSSSETKEEPEDDIEIKLEELSEDNLDDIEIELE